MRRSEEKRGEARQRQRQKAEAEQRSEEKRGKEANHQREPQELFLFGGDGSVLSLVLM